MPLRLQGQSMLSWASAVVTSRPVIEDYFTSSDSADKEDVEDSDSCMPGSAHSLEGTAK